MTDFTKWTDRELILYIRGALDIKAPTPRNVENLLDADKERERRKLKGMDVAFTDLDKLDDIKRWSP